MDKENTPLEEWENHKIKATLDLSGTTVKVGTYSHHQDDGLFIMTDEQVEPFYFSPTEADMLLTAINASKVELGED